MSNPLYEQVKSKVEASSLAQPQFGNYPMDWHEDLLEAERLRSLAVAGACAKLFAKCLSAFANFSGAIDRARTANALSALDETGLSNIGLKRTDLPGFVAGYVDEAQNSIKQYQSRQSDKKAA